MEQLSRPQYTVWYTPQGVCALSCGGAFYINEPFLEITQEIRSTLPTFWGILDRWRFEHTLFSFLVDLQDHDSDEVFGPLEDLLGNIYQL